MSKRVIRYPGEFETWQVGHTENIAEPVGGPAVSLAEIKKQLEIADADTAHDTQLAMLISAATNQFERVTRYLIGTRAVRITIDQFSNNALYLPVRPISAVTSFAVNGIDQMAAVEFDLDKTPASVEPISGTWPSVTRATSNIKIEVTAGVAFASVPTDIKQSILLLAAHWFENREQVITGTTATELPMGVGFIWDNYRIRDGYLLALGDGNGDC